MNPGPPHHEVLLSLAEEIRQTIAWLGFQEEPPSAVEIRSRIRNLREAAAVAGMGSVENALDALSDDLDDRDRSAVDLDARVELTLTRLSTLIGSMASAVEKQELEWVDLTREAENELDRLDGELNQASLRLTDYASLAESCITSTSPTERVQLLAELTSGLRAETTWQREVQRRLGHTVTRLRGASRKLVRELAGMRSLPVTPVLLRIRDHARDLGLNLDKPVSLHARVGGLDVGTRQLPPLERVLRFLVEHLLKEGMDKPKERRKEGKASVGNIRIDGQPGKALVALRILDDGRQERPDPRLTKPVRKDLGLLRARLLREEREGAGPELVLMLPTWHNSVEALPVRTEAGEYLVPLTVVSEVFTAGRAPVADGSTVSFERRSSRSDEDTKGSSGVVFTLGDWRGVLHAEILGSHLRVVPVAPDQTDPPWVIARVNDNQGSRPLVHPLPFMELGKDQIGLFP